jgi:lipoprotein-releasing system permease protein
MSLPLFISRRYVKSKRNSNLISLISIITILGIAIGVSVLILALTVLSGFENAIKEKITDFNEHIVISGYGNRNLPNDEFTVNNIINLTEPYLDKIESYQQKSVIIRTKEESSGVSLLGLSEQSLKIFDEYIVDALDSIINQQNFLYIGANLADNLNLFLGDKITLLALRNDEIPSFLNPPIIKQFTLVGIYESGMAQYDDFNVYTSKNSFEKIFGINQTVAGYNLKINDLSKVDSLEQHLQNQLSYPFYVQSIFNKHQNIFTWLELQKKPIPIILGMVILVAAFNMIGTILMIVLERYSEIGILRSLGMNRNGILKIFLYQGSYLSLIGIFLGNLIAILITFLQLQFDIISLPSSVYFLSSAPISLEFGYYLLVSVIAFIICFITTLVPGYIASKLNIIKAIRFE